MLIRGFLGPKAVEELLSDLRASSGAAANVYGSPTAVDSNVRRTTKVDVSPATRELVTTRLVAEREAIAAHFGIALGELDEPQFLRYDVGDFFVAHQDGNTPSIRDATLTRRVSIVVFLNPGEYGGGDFVIHGPYPERTTVVPEAGMLLAFPSETTHEVTAVTRGVRFTVASWFRAARSPLL
jgi:SM-20-related protein